MIREGVLATEPGRAFPLDAIAGGGGRSRARRTQGQAAAQNRLRTGGGDPGRGGDCANWPIEKINRTLAVTCDVFHGFYSPGSRGLRYNPSKPGRGAPDPKVLRRFGPGQFVAPRRSTPPADGRAAYSRRDGEGSLPYRPRRRGQAGGFSADRVPSVRTPQASAGAGRSGRGPRFDLHPGMPRRPDRGQPRRIAGHARRDGRRIVLTMSMSESTGAQDWRAVACLAPGGERLLCYGGSSAQVRAAYAGAWGEVIRDEDRPTVKAISPPALGRPGLGRAVGTPDLPGGPQHPRRQGHPGRGRGRLVQLTDASFGSRFLLYPRPGRGFFFGSGLGPKPGRGRPRPGSAGRPVFTTHPSLRTGSGSRAGVRSKECGVKRRALPALIRCLGGPLRLDPGHPSENVRNPVGSGSHRPQWIGLAPARPDLDVREGPGDPPGQVLDPRPLGRVVAGDNQADPERLGLERPVESSLTGQQGVGPLAQASPRKSSPAPQATASVAIVRSGSPDEVHRRRAQDRLHAPGQCRQRLRLGKHADPADSRTAGGADRPADRRRSPAPRTSGPTGSPRASSPGDRPGRRPRPATRGPSRAARPGRRPGSPPRSRRTSRGRPS